VKNNGYGKGKLEQRRNNCQYAITLADMHQRTAQMEANLHYQRGRAAALRKL
jgi:hypothetical protein